MAPGEPPEDPPEEPPEVPPDEPPEEPPEEPPDEPPEEVDGGGGGGTGCDAHAVLQSLQHIGSSVVTLKVHHVVPVGQILHAGSLQFLQHQERPLTNPQKDFPTGQEGAAA